MKTHFKKAEVNALIQVGQQMSNVLYNVGHHKATCDGDKKLFLDLVKQWDAARRPAKEEVA